MKISVITILIIVLGALIISSELKSESMEVNIKPKKLSKITAKQFVETIDSLKYFKYADKENIQNLKQNHIENFDSEGSWSGIWDDKTNLPLDFRYYFCDGEYVFEQDGFIGMLEKLGSIFKKIEFKIIIENHFEEWDSEKEWLNHRITINRTNYVIFKNFRGYGWGEVVHRFAEILNAEFEKQNIDEKIYLINGGNDGSIIFLNDKLYKFFYNTFTNPQWKPLEVKEWAKVMGIKEIKTE